MVAIKIIGIVFIGYLLGSISFGLILGRLWTHRDIRLYGSGRTGATNVMRTAGFLAAFPTALLDIGKGSLAVYLAWVIVNNDSITLDSYSFDQAPVAVLAGLASVMGHVWPIFLRFKGGRGVSVVFGVMLIFCWPAALLGFVLALLALALTRYVSMGSLVVVTVMPVVSAIYYTKGDLRLEYLIFSIIGGLLVILWHKDNIHRLLNGTERRIEQKVRIKDSRTG